MQSIIWFKKNRVWSIINSAFACVPCPMHESFPLVMILLGIKFYIVLFGLRFGARIEIKN